MNRICIISTTYKVDATIRCNKYIINAYKFNITYNFRFRSKKWECQRRCYKER